MIVDRTEFARHFDRLRLGLGNDDSVLWAAEAGSPSLQRSQWFVCVRPVRCWDFKRDYWSWCHQNLIGTVTCYSSDVENKQEWWGFTEYNDIVLWLLKWQR